MTGMKSKGRETGKWEKPRIYLSLDGRFVERDVILVWEGVTRLFMVSSPGGWPAVLNGKATPSPTFRVSNAFHPFISYLPFPTHPQKGRDIKVPSFMVLWSSVKVDTNASLSAVGQGKPVSFNSWGPTKSSHQRYFNFKHERFITWWDPDSII